MKIAIMSFAHVHASVYAALLAGLPGVEVLASDPDHGDRPGETGGADLAADLGVDYVPDYSTLLTWSPDGVVVCAENNRHRELVELAAAASADVLCEKPLATTPADGRAMIDLCARAGVQLMVAHPVRFSPSFLALADAVRSGALGEVIAASATNNGRLPTARAWFVDPSWSGGGALTDHAVHVLDLIDALFGGIPAVSVYAVAGSGLRPELPVESSGFVAVRYENDFLLTIDCSWSRPLSSPTWGGLTLQLVGTGGIADLDAFATRVDGLQEHTGRPLWLPYGPDLDRLMIEEFLRSIAEGRRPQPDGESGLRSLGVVAAAYESLASGQPVSVAVRG